jgi:hypothetical protein
LNIFWIQIQIINYLNIKLKSKVKIIICSGNSMT